MKKYIKQLSKKYVGIMGSCPRGEQCLLSLCPRGVQDNCPGQPPHEGEKSLIKAVLGGDTTYVLSRG